jgi:hypothetical protein
MEREDGNADAEVEAPSVPKLPIVEMLYCGGTSSILARISLC